MRLNDRAQESATPTRPVTDTRSPHRNDDALTRALGRARSAILWERLWPALAAPATAIGLFLALSWIGLWLWLPPVGRAVGLTAFLILAIVATVPLLRLRLPTRE